MLWYDKPATDWEKEALPIGNGRLGVMVFGGIDSERLQISEKSLWTGGPGSEGGYDYGLPAESQTELMRSIGKQLVDGAQLKPEYVAKQLGRKMHNYGDYQSFGDIIIERDVDAASVTGYRRELDLDTATARVQFKQGDADYRREYFVSYPDQLLVVALVRHRRAKAAGAVSTCPTTAARNSRWMARTSSCRERSNRTA